MKIWTAKAITVLKGTEFIKVTCKKSPDRKNSWSQQSTGFYETANYNDNNPG